MFLSCCQCPGAQRRDGAAAPCVCQLKSSGDRYHLNERLADLLRGLAPDAAARTAQLSRWNDSLDRNDQAIYRIRAWVRDQHAAALTQNDRPRLDQILVSRWLRSRSRPSRITAETDTPAASASSAAAVAGCTVTRSCFEF